MRKYPISKKFLNKVGSEYVRLLKVQKKGEQKGGLMGKLKAALKFKSKIFY